MSRIFGVPRASAIGVTALAFPALYFLSDVIEAIMLLGGLGFGYAVARAGALSLLAGATLVSASQGLREGASLRPARPNCSGAVRRTTSVAT
jgi:hypothetical protein